MQWFSAIFDKVGDKVGQDRSADFPVRCSEPIEGSNRILPSHGNFEARSGLESPRSVADPENQQVAPPGLSHFQVIT